MTGPRDELQASIRQGLRQPSPGIDGHLVVLWVGEQQHRRLDSRDGGLQFVQFA